MTTRDRILDSALQLFNEQGTGAVSTNHIAAAAGISPGNLYYHFRKKEEIIRALFERLFNRTDTDLAISGDEAVILDDVKRLVRTNFDILWEYRFIYRELVVLLQRDPVLHEQFVAVRKRGYDGFREIIHALAQAGVMTNRLDDDTITRLADLCWMITEFWLTMVEVSGQPVDASQMERGVDLMTHVLRPYIPI